MTDFRNNIVVQQSRGLRNNNPGNIKQGGLPWNGQVGTDATGEVIFDSIENGIRALTIDLANTQLIHGLSTLQAILNVYAPASDGNNPVEYANSVAQYMGVGPNDNFHMTSTNAPQLVRAIINYELGGGYAGYIDQGMIDAGVNSVPAKISMFLGTTSGKITAGAVIIGLVLLLYYFKKNSSRH